MGATTVPDRERVGSRGIRCYADTLAVTVAPDEVRGIATRRTEAGTSHPAGPSRGTEVTSTRSPGGGLGGFALSLDIISTGRAAL